MKHNRSRFLLIVIVLAVALLYVTVTALAGPGDIHLPIISKESGGINSSAAEPHTNVITDAIPPGLVFQGTFDGKPVYGPPMNGPLAQNLVEEIEQHRETVLNHVTFISVAGETTAGTVFTMAHQRIDLPENVYVQHFVGTVTCHPDRETYHCPVFPYRVLSTSDKLVKVRLESDGEAYVIIRAGETADTATSLTRLQWLVDQLGHELYVEEQIKEVRRNGEVRWVYRKTAQPQEAIDGN